MSPVAGGRASALRTAWQPVFTAVVLVAGLAARAWAPAGWDRTIWYAGLAVAGTAVVWARCAIAARWLGRLWAA